MNLGCGWVGVCQYAWQMRKVELNHHEHAYTTEISKTNLKKTIMKNVIVNVYGIRKNEIKNLHIQNEIVKSNTQERLLK